MVSYTGPGDRLFQGVLLDATKRFNTWNMSPKSSNSGSFHFRMAFLGRKTMRSHLYFLDTLSIILFVGANYQLWWCCGHHHSFIDTHVKNLDSPLRNVPHGISPNGGFAAKLAADFASTKVNICHPSSAFIVNVISSFLATTMPNIQPLEKEETKWLWLYLESTCKYSSGLIDAKSHIYQTDLPTIDFLNKDIF